MLIKKPSSDINTDSSNLKISLYKLTSPKKGVKVSLKGNIGAYDSFELDNLLRSIDRSHFDKVILDFDGLYHISSCGIGFILKLSRIFDKNLVIININERVLNIISLIGLKQVVNIKDSETEAIEFLNNL